MVCRGLEEAKATSYISYIATLHWSHQTVDVLKIGMMQASNAMKTAAFISPDRVYFFK